MPKLYTIGHSNHSLAEFLAIVQAHHLTDIIDIRTIPKSRRVPWFNQAPLAIALSKENIKYLHIKALGGLRATHKDSINQGWHNSSFRGFADYMQTREFYQALKQLNLLLKRNRKVAIMCAEAVPWRCHRQLIADAELIRHIKAFHIMSKTNTKLHQLTSFSVVDRTKKPIKIYYPESH